MSSLPLVRANSQDGVDIAADINRPRNIPNEFRTVHTQLIGINTQLIGTSEVIPASRSGILQRVDQREAIDSLDIPDQLHGVSPNITNHLNRSVTAPKRSYETHWDVFAAHKHVVPTHRDCSRLVGIVNTDNRKTL